MVRLRISVITSGSQPVIKLRWPDEEAKREEIAQDFKKVPEKQAGGVVKINSGKL